VPEEAGDASKIRGGGDEMRPKPVAQNGIASGVEEGYDHGPLTPFGKEMRRCSPLSYSLFPGGRIEPVIKERCRQTADPDAEHGHEVMEGGCAFPKGIRQATAESAQLGITLTPLEAGKNDLGENHPK